MNSLYRQGDLPKNLRIHIEAFSARVLDDDFPCFFAPVALREDQLLFGSANIGEGYTEVISLFKGAVSVIVDNPDQVVVLWLEGACSTTSTDDSRMTRELLLQLLQDDAGSWPSGAPVDPVDPDWNFWYCGVDFFINVSTPKHVARRSRNLGDLFTFVIQSRASFDNIPGHKGKIQDRIRSRIRKFDDLPPSPSLGTHGISPELPQFFLGDTNDLGGCPHLLERRDIEQVMKK